MRGTASACASATIVNAMATGMGAAFGIDLRVRAQVRLRRDGKIIGKIMGSRESPKLLEICVRKTLKEFGEEGLGADIQTTADIPIAVGLSSSSAAANAAVLATIAALGKKPNFKNVLKIAVDSAFAAGVTLTGALDDAAASLYGGAVVTDNSRMRILKRFKVDSRMGIAVHVPPSRLYTRSLRTTDFTPIKEGVEMAHTMAKKGRIWDALTLNGFLYSAIFGHDPRPALTAFLEGAIAAGITGKGPATVAVADLSVIPKIVERWRKMDGKIILTKPAVKGGEWSYHEKSHY
ncbi:MAG: shikimate kinase [Candidatus Hadarchaeales archaeon]